MPQYMMLLHECPSSFKDISPDQMQKVCEQYSAWAKGIAEKGQLIGGQKLTADHGRQLQNNKGKLVVSDGPYSETKEIIGGYFAIKEETYDAAVQIASSCPHLGYGGRIELRQIDEM
jgi:hypothetical protein